MLNAQPRQTLATITDTSARIGDEISGSGPTPIRPR